MARNLGVLAEMPEAAPVDGCAEAGSGSMVSKNVSIAFCNEKD